MTMPPPGGWKTVRRNTTQFVMTTMPKSNYKPLAPACVSRISMDLDRSTRLQDMPCTGSKRTHWERMHILRSQAGPASTLHCTISTLPSRMSRAMSFLPCHWYMGKPGHRRQPRGPTLCSLALVAACAPLPSNRSCPGKGTMRRYSTSTFLRWDQPGTALAGSLLQRPPARL